MCQDADTLRWLSNQNCITPHVWSARARRLDRPDLCSSTSTPRPGSDFTLVREGALLGGRAAARAGARAVRDGHRLARASTSSRRSSARATPTSSASGRASAAAEVAERSPDTLTTEWRKEKRDGKILVDTARNTYGQTVVAPYAVRALPGAPVATPLEWAELEGPGSLRAQSWTLRTLGERLAEKGDPWADITRHARALSG